MKVQAAPNSNLSGLRSPGEMVSAHEHRLRGVQGLINWNLFNLLLVLIPMFTPPNDFFPQVFRYVMFNAVVSGIFTWWKLNSPVQLIWPMRMLLLVQIWLTICSFISGLQLGRTNDFETSNYFLVMIVIFYFNGAMITYVWPKYRAVLLNLLLGIFTLSAVVGVLQFLKVPPALALARFYNARADITAWGVDASGVIVHGAGSVRAIGLGTVPEWLAFQGLLAWGIISSRLLYRQLKPWEFLAAMFFLMVALIAQSRVMYISLAICVIAFLVLLVRRDPKRGSLYVVSFAVCGMLLGIVAQERLSYAFGTNLQTDDTLRYRQEIGWVQAYQIIDERPWVGIGPDDGLVWRLRLITPDRWTQGTDLDNGFLLMASWGGYPALALFIGFLIFSLISAYTVVADRFATHERRRCAFVVGLAVVLVMNNMILNNGFTNIWFNCIFGALAAAATTSSSERIQELKCRLHVSRIRERVPFGGAKRLPEPQQES